MEEDAPALTNPDNPRSRRAERTGMALLATLFVAWACAFVRTSSFVSADGVRRYFLFDDSMISMRYAWNLAHGQGLVWNAGERVEGITNLLMTLYMTVWCSFLSKEAAVLAVQLSGIAFVLVAAFFSSRVVAGLAGREPWRGHAAARLSGRPARAGVPDASRCGRGRGGDLPVPCVSASFVVGVSVFRIIYYGHVTPNTYLLKVAGFPWPTASRTASASSIPSSARPASSSASRW